MAKTSTSKSKKKTSRATSAPRAKPGSAPSPKPGFLSAIRRGGAKPTKKSPGPPRSSSRSPSPATPAKRSQCAPTASSVRPSSSRNGSPGPDRHAPSAPVPPKTKDKKDARGGFLRLFRHPPTSAASSHAPTHPASAPPRRPSSTGQVPEGKDRASSSPSTSRPNATTPASGPRSSSPSPALPNKSGPGHPSHGAWRDVREMDMERTSRSKTLGLGDKLRDSGPGRKLEAFVGGKVLPANTGNGLDYDRFNKPGAGFPAVGSDVVSEQIDGPPDKHGRPVKIGVHRWPGPNKNSPVILGDHGNTSTATSAPDDFERMAGNVRGPDNKFHPGGRKFAFVAADMPGSDRSSAVRGKGAYEATVRDSRPYIIAHIKKEMAPSAIIAAGRSLGSAATIESLRDPNVDGAMLFTPTGDTRTVIEAGIRGGAHNMVPPKLRPLARPIGVPAIKTASTVADKVLFPSERRRVGGGTETVGFAPNEQLKAAGSDSGIKNKPVLLMNAEHDEFDPGGRSTARMVRQLQEAGAQVEVSQFKGGSHRSLPGRVVRDCYDGAARLDSRVVAEGDADPNLKKMNDFLGKWS